MIAQATPRERLVSGHPMPLELLAGAWLVEQGHLDVFAVQQMGGEPRGRREHLLRLEPGAALCAPRVAPEGQAVQLLIVGNRDTVMVPTELRAAIARWVLATATLWHDPAVSWVAELARPGEIRLKRDTVLGCLSHQLLWATVSEGCVADSGGLRVEPGMSALALSAATPLRTLVPSTVLLQTTEDLSDDALDAALMGHHARLRDYAARHLHEHEAERANRIAQTATAAEADLASGLDRLSDLNHGASASRQSDDACWFAVAYLAEALGVASGARPVGVASGASPGERVNRIAASFSLHFRPVLLREGWWRRDNGPLLAWREDGNPVVLLSDPKGYRLLEPGVDRRLSAAEALALEPEALSPYRGLSPGKIDARSFLQHMLYAARGEGLALLWLSVLAAILGVAVPLAVGVIAGGIVPRSDRMGLVLVGAGLFTAGLAEACVALTRGFVLQRVETRVTLATQAALFDRLLRLPVALLRRFGSADLADRTLVLDQIRRHLGGPRLGTILGGLVIFANIIVMLVCNLRLGLLGLAVGMFTAGIGLWLCARQAAKDRTQAELRGKTENLILEAIGGIAKLKVAAATERVFAVWARLYSEQLRAFIAARTIGIYQAVFNVAALPLGLAVLFLVTAGLSEQLRMQVEQTQALAEAIGEPLRSPTLLSIGAWLAFSAAFGQMMAAIAQMLQAVSAALPMLPLYARARPLLSGVPESGPSTALASNLSGGVEFSRVSFAYAADAPPVLQDISFDVRPGEFVAIVGRSGSGKSTVLRLLLGFESPTSGTILFDGRPLSALDITSVRRQIGVVLQNGRVVPGTILDNIGGGRPISLAEAWSAAELAGFMREIRALPMGMYTVLAEGAASLSGGQRQRLLIARALARRPALLLLDEATSALDNGTQAVVADAVAALGVTRLVVAHRLSTVAQADRILVLENGRLVQQGDYTTLIAQPGLFRDMAARQLA